MHTLITGKLRSDSVLLLWIGAIFIASMALSGTFLNIYIFRVDHSIKIIGEFNFFVYLAFPLSFLISGFLSKYMEEIWFIRIGVVLLTCFFVWLISQGNVPKVEISVLGILYGFGQGVYWFGFNILSFDWTSWEERSSFQGMAGFTGTIAATVCPFLSGYLISRTSNFTGYYIVFVLSLVLFGILFVVTIKTPHSHKITVFSPKEGFRFRQDLDWFRLWMGTIAFGIREGVYAFFIGILVYLITKSEGYFGVYSLVTGTISLISFFLAGKLQQWRVSLKTFISVASVLLGAVSFLWAIAANVFILWIFGVLTALIFPFFMVPFQTLLFNEIDETKRSASHRTEYFVSREIALAMGRLLGVGVIWWAGGFFSSQMITVIVGFLGFSFLLTAFATKKVEFRIPKNASR